MRCFLWVCLCLGLLSAGCVAVAAGVPAASPADFGTVSTAAVTAINESPEAHWIWSALAGIGAGGTILYGIMRLVWKIAKPYLDEWVAKRKLERLLSVIEIAVKSTGQVFVDNIKAGHEDGKLTEEEAKEALNQAQDAAIAIAKTQGMDIVKEYGLEAINWIIEYFVGKMGGENKVLKAVAAPLPASASAPISAPIPDLLDRTAGVSGLTTP